MTKNSASLPDFASLEEAAELFDTHDMSEYLDELPEVDCQFDLKKRTLLVTVEPEFVSQLAELARVRRMSTPDLISELLKKSLSQVT